MGEENRYSGCLMLVVCRPVVGHLPAASPAAILEGEADAYRRLVGDQLARLAVEVAGRLLGPEEERVVRRRQAEGLVGCPEVRAVD